MWYKIFSHLKISVGYRPYKNWCQVLVNSQAELSECITGIGSHKSLRMLNKHRNGCINHLNSTKHLTVPTNGPLEITANREIRKGVKPHKLATQILLLLHTGGMHYAQHCLWLLLFKIHLVTKGVSAFAWPVQPAKARVLELQCLENQ